MIERDIIWFPFFFFFGNPLLFCNLYFVFNFVFFSICKFCFSFFCFYLILCLVLNDLDTFHSTLPRRVILSELEHAFKRNAIVVTRRNFASPNRFLLIRSFDKIAIR